MTVSKTITIENHAGIHCRPSAAIMQAVKAYPKVKFTLDTPRGRIILNSLLELISMGLHQHETVKLSASGPDEVLACEEVAELFAKHFDFPPQH